MDAASLAGHEKRMSLPAPARILVIDDNAQNRALARETLKDEGYRVDLASSGEEGLEAFRKHPPDCVLLDIRMPGLDGTAVCKLIRALPHGGDVPIVFLTALRDVEVFDKAMEAGGNDFLTKPVKPGELVVRVQSALKVRRLSAELREQYEIVRHQRDALMRLQLQKERLSAFVIHDLKNPVGAMDLHAQVLLRMRDLPPAARESVEHIRDSARTLLRLILNLLDISKGEEGQLAPALTDVDLGALVGRTLEALAVRAADAEVALEKDLGVTLVRADADLLERVLENLLENAIRHAPRGSRVTVTSSSKEGNILLRVKDEGAGVPPEMREKIFERFVQVESPQTAVTRTGRGLGLSFCKLAVEAHGGRIWLEDAAPGAAFCIELKGRGS